MNSERPLHVAIIPDGNRRWAKKRALQPWKGHEQAVDNFRGLTEWCRKDPRVGVLTVWCFSTENWKRDPDEVAKLMTMLENYLKKERKGFLDEKTRFVHSGRKDRIPASLASVIAEVEEETKNQTDFTLHLAVDYGGQDELLRAIRKLKHPEHATEDMLREQFDHPDLPDIDLIVRTSGEQRTSNFFLWQSTYAEWCFVDKYFPDFTKDDLAGAVDDFAKRKRRFGS
jgi:undecaprenyl diphosphate synthase